jgi:mycothiol system anti-sigma-R factor
VACDLTPSVLHGYLDGELDAARASEFESHLHSCPRCAAELESQESLRSALRQAQLYERAPARLRAKVATNFRAPLRARRPVLWQWLAAAACFIVLLYAGWRATPWSVGRAHNAELVAQLVDDHIRSLQPGHLYDIASTDQHTVKPWFDGKIEFAPPVRDFSQEEFPLLGGRLDVLNRRTVAALVYGRRKHIINVFVWPDSASINGAQSGSLQGYNWIRWSTGSFEMWAVSDVSASDLGKLRDLFQGH